LCIFFQIMTGREMDLTGGLAGWWASGRFLTWVNITNVLRQISINTIIAVGMTLVIITGGIDLSVGSIVALAGVLSSAVLVTGFPPPLLYPKDASLSPVWPLAASLPVALVIAMAVGALCGAHNAIPIVRLRVPPFIATLAMYLIARGFAYIYVGGGQVASLPAKFTDMVGQGPLLVVVALITVIAGHILLQYTRFGRAIYAVGGNEKAAHLSGVNTAKTRFWVYVIVGVLAGIAGLLLAGRLQAGDPKCGDGYELSAIAAVVLGGASLMGGEGSVLGTLLGAVVIGSLDTGLSLMGVQDFVQKVVKGYVILMAVVLDQTKKRSK
ncbi:MAG TPA: ABC transporter permease, partial [Armatimonadota bacterium]|nr:ABC transporter permease [Armatimonadota bacterium]